MSKWNISEDMKRLYFCDTDRRLHRCNKRHIIRLLVWHGRENHIVVATQIGYYSYRYLLVETFWWDTGFDNCCSILLRSFRQHHRTMASQQMSYKESYSPRFGVRVGISWIGYGSRYRAWSHRRCHKRPCYRAYRYCNLSTHSIFRVVNALTSFPTLYNLR